MKNDKLQTWALIAEVVGGIAIIVSLIFVGLEVRQSSEAQRAATVLELKKDWVLLNLAQASSPELREAWVALEAANWDVEQLDRADFFAVQANIRVQIHNWSNAFYQYRIGTLEQEQWDPLIRDIESECQYDHFWKVWDGWGHIFDDPFREVIESKRPSE